MRPGGDGVGRAGAQQRDVAERPLDGVVAAGAVRSAVGTDVHRVGVEFPGQRRNDRGGVAVGDEQTAAEILVEGAQAPHQEGAARGTGGTQQRLVEHEQGEGTVGGVGDGQQGGQVPQPQVAAEPDDTGAAHPSSVRENGAGRAGSGRPG